jgi:hypothetical protein
LLGAFGCSGRLQAGYDVPHGALPVDERSALVMVNDGPHDNWQGEYALLLAVREEPRLVGIVVNDSSGYPSLDDNVSGFRQMTQAARDSGMKHVPEVMASVAPALVEPASGLIEDTEPNRSEGALFILDAATRYGTPAHPLVIATGGALTDAADAYLLDPTLPERAVVVATLGTGDSTGAHAGVPNGDTDVWATVIVTQRMRFVQVNGPYDETLDVPEARVPELPRNPFGTWIANNRKTILKLPFAPDQASVLAAARPWFASSVTRMRAVVGDQPPAMIPDPAGQVWHVDATDSNRARDEFWNTLKDPTTFD